MPLSAELEIELRKLSLDIISQPGGSANTELAPTQNALIEDTIADLNAGVFHVTRDRQPGAVTNITFNGAATNIAIASDNSIVEVHGGQTVNTGIRLEDLLGEIARIREALHQSDLPPEVREASGDHLVNAERELNSDQPDAGRMKRYLMAVKDLGTKIGISTAGGVLAKYIALLSGLE